MDEKDLKIEDIFKYWRELVGNLSQEIVILKSTIAALESEKGKVE